MNYEIDFPKGVRDNPAILKCCLPNGMPIIVMQSIKPKKKCVRHMTNPPHNNHIIFMRIFKQPPELPLSVTVLPNGHNASSASFKVCNPNGIPIIVIIRIKLATKYSMLVTMPPRRSQMMFPNNFINRGILNCLITTIWGRFFSPSMGGGWGKAPQNLFFYYVEAIAQFGFYRLGWR